MRVFCVDIRQVVVIVAVAAVAAAVVVVENPNIFLKNRKRKFPADFGSDLGSFPDHFRGFSKTENSTN